MQCFNYKERSPTQEQTSNQNSLGLSRRASSTTCLQYRDNLRAEPAGGTTVAQLCRSEEGRVLGIKLMLPAITFISQSKNANRGPHVICLNI